MPDVRNDPPVFREFRDALGTRDPKTVATYLTTMRGFMAWMAAQPGGTPFHVELVTETAVRGYMDALKLAGRAPRLRDLGDRKLYSIEAPALYTNLDLLLGGMINTKQITDHWDELLRLSPPDLSARLRLAFRLPPLEGVQLLHSVIEDLFALVETHIPDFNTQLYREKVQQRRGVWDQPPGT
jgi:hypothetical protein